MRKRGKITQRILMKLNELIDDKILYCGIFIMKHRVSPAESYPAKIIIFTHRIRIGIAQFCPSVGIWHKQRNHKPKKIQHA